MLQVSPRKPARQFLGKIDNFSDKQEANFYGKMLKAYIQGCDRFKIGRDPETKEPVYGNVMQRYNTTKTVGGKHE